MTLMHPLEVAGCGCDALDQGQGQRLMPISAALAVIKDWTTISAGGEVIGLEQARGRILAAPVTAQAMTPPFDNSAMDGYTLCTADLRGEGPWTLTVSHCIRAGSPADMPLQAGQAMQVFTGAPLPVEADTVVMRERVLRSGDHITLTRRPKPQDNIRYTGEDMRPGQLIVDVGRRLDTAAIAAIAAAGCGLIQVRPRPRIAILTTGDEVRSAGTVLGAAAIWDVNSPMLTAAVTGAGAAVVEVIHGGDSLEALRDTLAELCQRVDVIVTTGGISVGAADFVKPAIAELGGEFGFSGVALKPGKPVSFGRIGAAYWLGLPGNPVSALVTWTLFGPQLLSELTGATSPAARRRHVVVDAALTHHTGRCELRLATLFGFDGLGREVVCCPQETKSAQVSRLVEADGLVFIPAEADSIPKGGMVEFLPFNS
ncbi:MAG: molybdopterin molybdenumtransferase MoeA [Rhodobacteraceae bacterium]|nr:MAG: molybdopterin molybdenumtransferase MoeA [Paracoccaceae bacterium]